MPSKKRNGIAFYRVLMREQYALSTIRVLKPLVEISPSFTTRRLPHRKVNFNFKYLGKLKIYFKWKYVENESGHEMGMTN
jgi:hypothetical protein